ncbi:MAG: hypothetical protein JRI46_01005 [Deltaproteobacteria bacterium]|nr:hypothetical protein [Deltaproteobacteria bacterium]
MKEEKIGIGPSGRIGGLIQVIAWIVVGIVIFVYFLPVDLIILKILPATLIMLIAIGHLVLLGDNWPLSPPAGSWRPEKSRFVAGLGMTVIWAIFTFAILLFMIFIYPKWPIGPLYLWFGVVGFWLTLLYGINWGGWPFKGRLHPWVTMFISFIIVFGLSILIWNFLTNLDGTPLADTPMNHKGPLNVDWLTGFLVWSIGWFFVFSPVFTTQGSPFRKWGHPGAAIGQTILAHILGYLSWKLSLSLGLSLTFSFAAIGSSLIFWPLVHSWHLGFWGVAKYTQPKRGIYGFILQCVIIAVWIFILRAILGPIAGTAAELKLPADVNIFIIYLNLCIVAPALIAHNAFWLRWPLTLPTPPGTPPPDQAGG